MQDLDFVQRRAPYAPISALRDFFERIREVAVPPRVDRRFLQKLSVASSNEWSLLSALKFLGVLDTQGTPTHSYRLLQNTEQFEIGLRHLVETAYRPLLEIGGLKMSSRDLENYFRVASSPSQAKNAARFFREVCKMADLSGNIPGRQAPAKSTDLQLGTPAEDERLEIFELSKLRQLRLHEQRIRARLQLLEKLPTMKPEWSSEECIAICDRFLRMLTLLESDNPGGF